MRYTEMSLTSLPAAIPTAMSEETLWRHWRIFEMNWPQGHHALKAYLYGFSNSYERQSFLEVRIQLLLCIWKTFLPCLSFPI